MERIFKLFGKEYKDVNKAALLLGVFAFLSQLLGLVRDRSIVHFVGPSSELDAYYAAFQVPDFIFISVASLFAVTVLIPFLLEKMTGREVTEDAINLLNNIFTVFFASIILISIIIYFLIPSLVPLITPGFDSAMHEKVISLSRIMLLSPILLGLSNIFGSVTQLFRKFFVYALSPIFYNLGIIIGIVVFYNKIGVYGLALGVVLGAFMHFGVQFISSHYCGFKVSFSRKIDFKKIKEVVLVSLPRTLALSLNSMVLVVIIGVASFLSEGSISIFKLSWNLQSVPLGIIGLSYAVASFPTLSKSFSEKRMDNFKESVSSAARNIIFWSLPATFLFIVLRAQIVRVVLGTNAFSWYNTRLVAASVAIFSLSVVAQGLIALFSRVYYAAGNTKKPLYINLVSTLSIIVFTFLFLKVFQVYEPFRYFTESIFKVSEVPGTKVLMLPLAYSLGSILNLILFWIYIKKDFLQGKDFLSKTFFQSLGASFFLGGVSYLSLNALNDVFNVNSFFGVLLHGFTSGLLGIAAASVVLYFLENAEFRSLILNIKMRFWKNTEVIVPSQEEL